MPQEHYLARKTLIWLLHLYLYEHYSSSHEIKIWNILAWLQSDPCCPPHPLPAMQKNKTCSVSDGNQTFLPCNLPCTAGCQETITICKMHNRVLENLATYIVLTWKLLPSYEIEFCKNNQASENKNGSLCKWRPNSIKII